LKSPGDAYRYAIILIALTLLLTASMEVSSHEKLKPIANEIKRLADELELYTLTFMIMLEKSEEDKVVATARDPEELTISFNSLQFMRL
jgi:hypothetical protein